MGAPQLPCPAAGIISLFYWLEESARTNFITSRFQEGYRCLVSETCDTQGSFSGKMTVRCSMLIRPTGSGVLKEVENVCWMSTGLQMTSMSTKSVDPKCLLPWEVGIKTSLRFELGKLEAVSEVGMFGVVSWRWHDGGSSNVTLIERYGSCQVRRADSIEIGSTMIGNGHRQQGWGRGHQFNAPLLAQSDFLSSYGGAKRWDETQTLRPHAPSQSFTIFFPEMPIIAGMRLRRCLA
jgi:hypothetical protein